MYVFALIVLYIHIHPPLYSQSITMFVNAICCHISVKLYMGILLQACHLLIPKKYRHHLFASLWKWGGLMPSVRLCLHGQKRLGGGGQVLLPLFPGSPVLRTEPRNTTDHCQYIAWPHSQALPTPGNMAIHHHGH